MPQAFPIVMNALRAAAEPTRLRLLELLTHGELTVGEICSVLDQSQPRISRHLKLLCDAGLLARFREEHWVYYRVPLNGHGCEVVTQLCKLIARDDAILQADHRRMAKVLAERAQQAPTAVTCGASENKPLAKLDAVLIEELAQSPIGALLDVATGSGHILRTLARHATDAVGVDISTEALRFARTQAYGAGLSHCIFRRGDMYGLPFADASFDTVTLDRVLVAAEYPERALLEAARTLRPRGRLCVIEDFDALEQASNVKNPLTVLRAWFAQAGLDCERLRPIDTGNAHFIVALARSAASRLVRAA